MQKRNPHTNFSGVKAMYSWLCVLLMLCDEGISENKYTTLMLCHIGAPSCSTNYTLWRKSEGKERVEGMHFSALCLVSAFITILSSFFRVESHFQSIQGKWFRVGLTLD